MFDWFMDVPSYSLAATGIKFKSREFCSRGMAEEAMYKACKKYGLQIEKAYRDNHDHTFVCNHGVRFYIQRA